MYPYETPFGVIMKINRQVVPAYSPDVFQKDHAFWSQYSARLIGNWITYDTTVKQIADFAEKVYLHRDTSGFKGSQEFIRDDHAQQAFSKLRSSIAGLYAWRLGALGQVPTPSEYLPQNETDRQELIREADLPSNRRSPSVRTAPKWFSVTLIFWSCLAVSTMPSF